MGYAVIKNNVVENMIVWDGVTPYTPPEGTILVASDIAEIGWIYNPETGDITPPIKSENTGTL
jgi:hypothetical protein